MLDFGCIGCRERMTGTYLAFTCECHVRRDYGPYSGGDYLYPCPTHTCTADIEARARAEAERRYWHGRRIP